jgi:hypothetical protein
MLRAELEWFCEGATLHVARLEGDGTSYVLRRLSGVPRNSVKQAKTALIDLGDFLAPSINVDRTLL